MPCGADAPPVSTADPTACQAAVASRWQMAQQQMQCPAGRHWRRWLDLELPAPAAKRRSKLSSTKHGASVLGIVGCWLVVMCSAFNCCVVGSAACCKGHMPASSAVGWTHTSALRCAYGLLTVAVQFIILRIPAPSSVCCCCRCCGCVAIPGQSPPGPSRSLSQAPRPTSRSREARVGPSCR